MRHHSGKFGFFLRPQNQSAIDVEKSARQRERIHFVRVDHLDRNGTRASELRTRFWPTRFTYSVTTGSSINLEERSTSCASPLPNPISRSSEYRLMPLPTLRLPMASTSSLEFFGLTVSFCSTGFCWPACVCSEGGSTLRGRGPAVGFALIRFHPPRWQVALASALCLAFLSWYRLPVACLEYTPACCR